MPTPLSHAAQTTPTLAWRCDQPDATFSIRDSMAHGVLNRRLWLLGGYGLGGIRINDVWSSADGVEWRCDLDQAPWAARNLPGYCVFGNALWIMGGLTGVAGDIEQARGDVWRSIDGVNWECVCKEAAWSGRGALKTVAYNQRLWVFGGFNERFEAFGDIWSSADGVVWQQETDAAPWGPRSMFEIVEHRGRLWLIGGGIYDPTCDMNIKVNHADVWVSEDARTWRRAVETAPWAARRFHRAAAYHDHIWLLGGYTDQGNQNDVWRSVDGQMWEPVRSPEKWSVRHEPACFVHRDRLWIVGGFGKVLYNDAWSTDGRIVGG